MFTKLHFSVHEYGGKTKFSDCEFLVSGSLARCIVCQYLELADLTAHGSLAIYLSPMAVVCVIV